MILLVTKTQEIEVSREVEQRITTAKKQKLCVACLKPLDGIPIRGCHSKCHRATLRCIEDHLTTEIERMVEGKLLPKGKAGRKPSNPVTQELNKEVRTHDRNSMPI